MAIIQKSPLTRHLMLLFMAASLFLLWAAWQQSFRWLRWSPAQQTEAPLGSHLTPRARDTRVNVSLSQRQVSVYRYDKLIAQYPVAVGQAGWETPMGSFVVQQMQRHPDWQHPITQQVIPSGPSNPLGDRWIGFHHDQYMAIGFHGTNQEQLIGSAVSHGCLRLRNEDIRQLYEQISLGTPVIIQP